MEFFRSVNFQIGSPISSILLYFLLLRFVLLVLLLLFLVVGLRLIFVEGENESRAAEWKNKFWLSVEIFSTRSFFSFLFLSISRFFLAYICHFL